MRLVGGEIVPADVIVVGVGVTPNTQWLEGSGLRLRDGIVCDANLNALDVKRSTLVGDTIHVEAEVTEHRLTSKGDRGLVRFANRVVNQHGEAVLEYDPLRMLKRRP